MHSRPDSTDRCWGAALAGAGAGRVCARSRAHASRCACVAARARACPSFRGVSLKNVASRCWWVSSASSLRGIAVQRSVACRSIAISVTMSQQAAGAPARNAAAAGNVAGLAPIPTESFWQTESVRCLLLPAACLGMCPTQWLALFRTHATVRRSCQNRSCYQQRQHTSLSVEGWLEWGLRIG